MITWIKFDFHEFFSKFIWISIYCSNHPANICYSWRRLQHDFSVTILRLPVRIEDVLKTSSRRLGRRKIVTLNTSWRLLEDMSWRRLEDMSWRSLEDMSWRCLEDMFWRRLEDTMERNKILTGDLTNLNMYLTNLYFTNLYLAILRRIHNALITTQ